MKIKKQKAQKSVSWKKTLIWRLEILFKSNSNWEENKPTRKRFDFDSLK